MTFCLKGIGMELLDAIVFCLETPKKSINTMLPQKAIELCLYSYIIPYSHPELNKGACMLA